MNLGRSDRPLQIVLVKECVNAILSIEYFSGLIAGIIF